MGQSLVDRVTALVVAIGKAMRGDELDQSIVHVLPALFPRGRINFARIGTIRVAHIQRRVDVCVVVLVLGVVTNCFGLSRQRQAIRRRYDNPHGLQLDCLLMRQVLRMIVRFESLFFDPSGQYQQVRVVLVLSIHVLDIIVSVQTVELVQLCVAFVPLIAGFGLIVVVVVAVHPTNGMRVVGKTCSPGGLSDRDSRQDKGLDTTTTPTWWE